MENRELYDFNKELIEEVKNYAAENSENTESAFTSVFLSYLADFGETKAADSEVLYCVKESEKFKVNAYAFSEYLSTTKPLTNNGDNTQDKP